MERLLGACRTLFGAWRSHFSGHAEKIIYFSAFTA
jgi:hypothetical protein